jgi:transcriptional regulator with XRE-family HTH domain
MSLGEKLLELRNGKKQEQIAFDLEVSQSTYCDWENDVSIPKRKNLIKLAEYFNVDLSELDEEIYNVSVGNIENSVALINSPNSRIKNSTEAIIKIADSLERLTLLVEKLIEEKK